MRGRILTESIGEDVELASVSIKANLLFDRLLTQTDDAALAPGDPTIIKGKCFPFMDEMTIADIRRSTAELIDKKLLFPLQHNSRAVLAFKPRSFANIQRLRQDYKRKFNYDELSQVVYSQGLPGTVADPFGFGASTSTSTTTSTSTSPSPRSTLGCTPLQNAVGVPPESLLDFPVKHRKEDPASWSLTQDYVSELEAIFDGLDVFGQCKRALGWVLADTTRKKTARGMKKFLFGWMSRCGVQKGTNAMRVTASDEPPGFVRKEETAEELRASILNGGKS